MSEDTQDERLLSLESSVRGLVGTIERVAVSQENMLERMDKGFTLMAEAHVDFGKQNAVFDARLKPFEEAAEKKAKRSEFVKKMAIPALTAMAGVFGAKFGGQIVTWIGSLFGR
jgi:hypothetical protein